MREIEKKSNCVSCTSLYIMNVCYERQLTYIIKLLKKIKIY